MSEEMRLPVFCWRLHRAISRSSEAGVRRTSPQVMDRPPQVINEIIARAPRRKPEDGSGTGCCLRDKRGSRRIIDRLNSRSGLQIRSEDDPAPSQGSLASGPIKEHDPPWLDQWLA